MAHSPEVTNMALFCDFENVALGVQDAKYERFDIGKVLERLLLKGSIVVKKAYCDWDRYKAFKAPMHEASFELIEIPHVRQSGKNSADIRMVVDALDLCYTKSHVETFVIISGDSDFSPLVSKLRENNKSVIAIGVRESSSALLIENCDEFIFYEDLSAESAPALGAQPTGSRHVTDGLGSRGRADDEVTLGARRVGLQGPDQPPDIGPALGLLDHLAKTQIELGELVGEGVPGVLRLGRHQIPYPFQLCAELPQTTGHIGVGGVKGQPRPQ